MDPVTNKAVLEFLLQIITIHGLPMVMGFMVIVFSLYLIYSILKRKGLIGNNPNKLLAEVIENISKGDHNHQIILEVLSKILEKQDSFLTPEQAIIVCNLAMECLSARIVKIVMEIFVANNIAGNEVEVCNTLKSELECAIRTIEKEIEILPNVKDLLVPIENKFKILDSCCDSFIIIMKSDKSEREVARKVKSIITTSIKNNWVY